MYFLSGDETCVKVMPLAFVTSVNVTGRRLGRAREARRRRGDDSAARTVAARVELASR